MKFYKSDWFLRIASLVAAIVVWFYVVYQENPQMSKWVTAIPIISENLSPDFENGKLVIVSIADEEASVKLNGRRRVVSGVNSKNAQATVDMSNITDAGTYDLPINLSLQATGLEIMQVSPNYYRVVVDRVITEERKIEIETKGSVASGHNLDDVTVNPTVVKLTGPKSELDAIAQCRISVDLTDAKEDIKSMHRIKFYGSDGQEITKTSVTKNVEYAGAYCSVSTVKTVPVEAMLSGEVNTNGQKITAVCEPMTVSIKGKTAAINDIEKLTTTMIDISQIAEDTEIDIELELPDGIFYLAEDTKIKVKITVGE